MSRRYDYDLQSAKLLQQASRAASGWQPPKPRKPVAPPKPDLWWIAQAIMGAVSNAVSDGDPIDMLAPRVAARYGINGVMDRHTGISSWDVWKLLDRAARKHLGVKSYNAYLEQMWDAYNEGVEASERVDNPWR